MNKEYFHTYEISQLKNLARARNCPRSLIRAEEIVPEVVLQLVETHEPM
jgi:hypothetical protein